MKELVFLVEEASAKAMLESLMPRLLDEKVRLRVIPFEGKQDLERQLVRRIRGYQNQEARFIVLRDQDSHPNCVELKQRLLGLCEQSGKAPQCLVRIACRELESYYLADLEAVERALNIPGLSRQQPKKKYKAPDGLGSPSHELRDLTGRRYEKVAGSREIGKYLRLDNGRSPSFRNLISAVNRMQGEMLEGVL